MYDSFEILSEYDFMAAEKMDKLNLDKLGYDSSVENNLKILNDNNWKQMGEFLFYITLEKQSLKKVNIWIDIRTGDIADEKIVQEEIIKYYSNEGFSKYKLTNLLYKWESIANHKPKRIWIDSNTGLPPILEPLEHGEGEYIYSDSEDESNEKDTLLPDIVLRKRYTRNNSIIEENEDDRKDICNVIYNFIKSIFI